MPAHRRLRDPLSHHVEELVSLCPWAFAVGAGVRDSRSRSRGYCALSWDAGRQAGEDSEELGQ